MVIVKKIHYTKMQIFFVPFLNIFYLVKGTALPVTKFITNIFFKLDYAIEIKLKIFF